MGSTLSLGMMNVGQKQELTPGPPFSPTAANDGLSVHPVSGAIVLGSNLGSPIPGMLLDNRMIEMAGNRFVWREAGNDVFDINNALGTIMIGERIGVNVHNGFEIRNGLDIVGYVNNAIYMILSQNNTQLGDVGFVGNGAQLDISDSPIQFIMQSLAGGTPAPYLFIDIATGTFALGDVNGITNGNKLVIDDATSNFQFKTISARMMDLQFGTMVVQMGDIDTFSSGLIETLDGLTTHDVSNAANTAVYSINGNAGTSGMITAANVATVEGGIITAIV